MTYHSSPKKSRQYGGKAASCCHFVDRNLKPVSPKKEQFEPTSATPIAQHKRMAGTG